MSERWVLGGGREGSGVFEMSSRAFRKNLGVLGMEVSSESAYRFAHEAEGPGNHKCDPRLGFLINLSVLCAILRICLVLLPR